jgi:hypothetical protein
MMRPFLFRRLSGSYPWLAIIGYCTLLGIVCLLLSAITRWPLFKSMGFWLLAPQLTVGALLLLLVALHWLGTSAVAALGAGKRPRNGLAEGSWLEGMVVPVPHSAGAGEVEERTARAVLAAPQDPRPWNLILRAFRSAQEQPNEWSLSLAFPTHQADPGAGNDATDLRDLEGRSVTLVLSLEGGAVVRLSARLRWSAGQGAVSDLEPLGTTAPSSIRRVKILLGPKQPRTTP